MGSEIDEYVGLLFIGACLTFPSFNRQLKKRRVVANGVSTNGMIVSLNPADDNYNYPVVQFATTDGKWITGEYRETTSSGYINQSVVVLYNSRNPKEFIVISNIFYRNYNEIDFPLLVGISLFTLGAIGIINYYR